MKITILAFAQAKDRFGFAEKKVEYEPSETARGLMMKICDESDLKDLRVAIDCEFSEWDEPIGEASELALIPPVSGG